MKIPTIIYLGSLIIINLLTIMNFISELIKLVGMLFTSHPKDYEDVEIVVMKHFPFKDFIMMWCGCLIVREEDYDAASGVISHYTSWKNHELVHLRRAQRKEYLNSWILYYLNYLMWWIFSGPISNRYRRGAYYTNPHEVEAYANELRGDYIPDCPLWKSKYNFKKKRKTFRKYITGTGWRNYLKTI